MKKTLSLALMLSLAILFSCNNKSGTNSAQNAKNDEFYFDYSIDGKEISLDTTDILTSYNEFSATDREFKVFAGKDAGPNLVLTLTADMSKPSHTANGSAEAGDKISQGSVSLQNYPSKGFTFNSYDYLLNPKPTVIPDAIVITNSEKMGETARILTGTINVIVRGGENKENDPAIKDYVIKGKFRIKSIIN
jgi:ABC-type oligopeptide transport system substrate-binding subunit